ncbi:MAG: tRNA1(Val) (adenine(37)-N6)-methyltransferase [Eubacteriales bacterium]|jgi:tRNA1Val (adenine37-N6)-methyltransferase
MESIVTTRINAGIVLDEYKGGIRFGTDTLLLSHFCGKGKKGCDLGSGSGVLSFLLLSLGKAKHMTGVELVGEYADLSCQNAQKNGFSDVFECINHGVEDAKDKITPGSMDFVATNPPYLKNVTGKRNENYLKFVSYHETTAGIDKFCSLASYILKSGGKFYCVYRPEYLAKLIHAMELAKIKPKVIRFVHPSPGKKPSLVLVEGKKEANDGLTIHPPLYIYADESHTKYSAETEGIYNELA